MKMIKDIYDKKYKVLLIIPFLMLVLSIGYLVNFNAQTGSYINKGISLKGGTSMTIISEDVVVGDVESLLIGYEGQLSSRKLSSSGKQLGLIIELEETDKDKIDTFRSAIMDKLSLNENLVTIEIIGSSLGASFFKETVKAMIFAFILMGIIVFLYFRTIVPSMAVILAALSDIVVTLAIVNISGIKLSTAGIAAFLMLIGYSVDTDVLLSTKVLRTKEGTILKRVYTAMKTGTMMTFTTFVAMSIALLFSQSPVISQIMTILLIGLGVDVINTWIQNAGILRWYMESKK